MSRHWVQSHSPTCAVESCGREYHARNYCLMHYVAARRRGELPKLTTEDVFVGNFDINEAGCWQWLGNKDAKGYGFIGVGKKTRQRAHRWVWDTYVSPIPEGWQIDHLCRNPSCVNPDHLEPVPGMENQRRRWNVSHHCLDCGSRNIKTVFSDLDLTVT
jgi:hypothetical protein